jgi:hypothetical protein
MPNKHHVHYTFETQEGKKVVKKQGETELSSNYTPDQIKESKEVNQVLVDFVLRESGIVAKNLKIVKIEKG